MISSDKYSKITKFIPRKSTSKGKMSKGLGMLSFYVYHGLKLRSDSKDIVQISYYDLHELLNISKSSAQKAIAILTKEKLIKRLPPEFRTATPIYKIYN